MSDSDSTPTLERMCRAMEEADNAGSANRLPWQDYEHLARAALDASGNDELARGFWMGLDHIAGFINALDSDGMSGKEVRSAIYSECLTARPAAIARTQEQSDGE